MEPALETTHWLDIPVPPGKEDTMENTNSSFRPQRAEDPFQTNVSVIHWSPVETTRATPDSSDLLSMLVKRATEIVASKPDLIHVQYSRYPRTPPTSAAYFGYSEGPLN